MSNVSQTFNAQSGGDVVFRSSDNILFHVHKDALGYNSGGFPIAEMVITTDTVEIVPLQESSSVLELLFQFVYPRKHPGLDDMDFSSFYALAEAAEKYEVFFAMNACQMRMKDYLPKYATEVFAFAAKHDYVHLLNSVAPLFVGKPLSEVVHVLPMDLYIPWTIYYDQWSRCLDKCLAAFDPFGCTNPHRMRRLKDIETALRQDVARLRKCDAFFREPHHCEDCRCRSDEIIAKCQYCAPDFVTWKESIKAEAAKIPDFLTFWKDYRRQLALQGI